MTGGPGQFHAAERFKRNLEVPFGYFPQPVYFASIARRHMHEFGTTAEQLGAIAVSCRRHANRHPGAIMREKALTLGDYLAESRPAILRDDLPALSLSLPLKPTGPRLLARVLQLHPDLGME